MIRKNLIVCNLLQTDQSGKASFDKFMASFHPETEPCPYCSSRSSCSVYAYYHRYLIDFVDGHPSVERARILRVRCSSCKTTHAILPDPIIPYEQHSLLFILTALSGYFLHIMTIEKICETYGICESTFYRWRHKFEDHRREWLGKLRSAEASLIQSILDIVRKKPFSDFASLFFEKTGMSFMQSHKNPAHSQREPLTPDSGFP